MKGDAAMGMGDGPGAQNGDMFAPCLAFLKRNEKIHVAWCAGGILGFLLLYGVLQERVIAEQYVGPDGQGENFGYTLFIVLINRLVTSTAAFTLIMMSTDTSGKTSAETSAKSAYAKIMPEASFWNYLALSGSNVTATFCQYEAIKYVSFPVATLGKCGKMIPVMIWGSLVNGRSYKMQDYIITLLVTGGCTMFGLTGNISSKVHKDSSLFGIMLMVGYLAFDGFTSTWQENMLKVRHGSIYNMTLYVQLTSAAVSLTALVSFSQLEPAIAFLRRHPQCLWNILELSLSTTISNFFITHTIKTFGALFFATVMTTRQLLSILLSCFIFFHPLTYGQVAATAIVFGALYYKNLYSSSKKDKEGSKGSKEQSVGSNLEAGKMPSATEPPSALERLLAASK